jgi:hypothetical protein
VEHYSNNANINAIANANANVTGLRDAIANCKDPNAMLALSMELMNAQQVLTMMVESFTKSSKVQHDAGKKGMNVQGS